jgi:hypothetical protein
MLESGHAGDTAGIHPEISAGTLDLLERRLEMGRHDRFLEVRSRPDSELSEFSTDGCSGGLSVGWDYLASRIDSFETQLGNRPPWESCCVTHDKAYHLGGPGDAMAENSFEARKEADTTLRDCIVESGKRDSAELERRFGFSPDDSALLYDVVAGSMYRAVRIGGIPCSGLPWRWGYGWPACD